MKKVSLLVVALCMLTSTAFAYSSYWEDEVSKTFAAVVEHQEAGAFSFAFITDIHNEVNHGQSPKLLAYLLRELKIDYYINGGDFATDGALNSEQMTIEDLQNAQSKFDGIRATALKVEGNHDAVYSTTGGYYAQNLTPDRLRNTYFKDQEGNFAATGNYYYVDDQYNKIRYIVLNTQDKSYDEDSEGRAIDNKMWDYVISKDQISWLRYWALILPDDWVIVVASHVPPGEIAINGSDYVVDNYQEVVDLLNGTGKVVCWVAGHSHVDKLFSLNGLTVVVTMNDGARQEPGAPEKIEGTDTEQAFDIFSILREERTVYITRVGVGEDREFSF